MVYVGTAILLVVLLIGINKLIHNTPFKKDLHGDPHDIVRGILHDD